MKNTLKAVKKVLQQKIDYVRDGDIYITANENIVPHDVMMPCIGIRDGDIEREEGVGCTNVKYSVLVFPYVSLAKTEAVVVGDDSSKEKGLLDIVADINEILNGNLLDTDEIISAVAGRKEKHIQKVEDEGGYCFRKITTVEYERRITDSPQLAANQ
ncbi:MAG: hypothetical protein GY749_23970 [Desulfobacteraceae bacterium]|nr:hypothetical protein [Desulfobacteraceae bacterium]